MSTRIRQAGFAISLICEAYVYHKRRVNMRLFCRQVYVFGMSRITLYLLYPDSLKLVHWLPAVFVMGVAAMAVLAAVVSWMWLLLLAAYLLAVFGCALAMTKSLKIAALSIVASVVQLGGYGCGFLKAFFTKIILRRGRNIEEEIAIRKENKHTQTSLRWKHLTGQAGLPTYRRRTVRGRRRWLLGWRR